MGSPVRLAVLALALAASGAGAPWIRAASADEPAAAPPVRVRVFGSPGPAPVRWGSPAPVVVEVRDPLPGARVVLALPTRGFGGRETEPIVEARLPETAGGPGSWSRVEAVVEFPETAAEIEIRVEEPGRPETRIRVPLVPIEGFQTLVIVTPAGSGCAGALASVTVTPEQGRPAVPVLVAAELEPALLPRCAAGFSAASAVVIAEDPGPLAAETVRALRDYVATGGTLVVAAGTEAPAAWRCGIGDLLPADVSGVVPVAAVALARRFGGGASDAREILAARLVPLPGARVEAAAGGLPIVVRRGFGRGTVVACAVKLAQAGRRAVPVGEKAVLVEGDGVGVSLENLGILAGLLDHLGLLGTGTLLGARPLLEPWQAILPLDAPPGAAPPARDETSDNELDWAFRLNYMGTLPGEPGLPGAAKDPPWVVPELEASLAEQVLSGIAAPSPPVATVAVGAGVYVAFLGVLLAWTRRAGRAGLGYALAAVPSLLGVGTVVALAGSMHGPAGAAAVVGVVEAGAGASVGEATLAVGVYSPGAGEFDVALPSGTQWIGNRGTPVVARPGTDGTAGRALWRTDARSAAAVLARGFLPLGEGISCEWRDDGVLVRNGTPWRLRDAVVVRGRDVAEIGDLPPGRGGRALVPPGRAPEFRFPTDPPPVTRGWPGLRRDEGEWAGRVAAAALGGPPLFLAWASAPELAPTVSGIALPGRARVLLAAWLSPPPRRGWTAAPFPSAAGAAGAPAIGTKGGVLPVGLSGLVALRAPEDAPDPGGAGLRLSAVSPGVVLNVPRAGVALWDAWEGRWRELPEPTEVWRGEATIGAREERGDLPGPAARYALPGGVFLLATPWRGKAIADPAPERSFGFRVLEASILPEARPR